MALQWSDLDEANCTISVSKQASWDTEGNLILSQPKTGNSIREVSIPQDAVELLKQEHAKHPDNPWMFPSSRKGEMYHPDSVVNLHKKILKDAGLEHIHFHDLRHPYVKPTTKKFLSFFKFEMAISLRAFLCFALLLGIKEGPQLVPFIR